MTRQPAPRRWFTEPRLQLLLLVAIVTAYVGPVLYLTALSQPESWLQARAWFDPRFLHYNLALFLMAVLIVPFITYFYVKSGGKEKIRRLELELEEELADRPRELRHCKDLVHTLVSGQIRFGNYLGSMILLMLIITLGASIILLLKPLPEFRGLDAGLDYGRGANVLLLGPFVESFGTPEFYHRLVISLTAFLFGFLGAYVYFIGYLVRSFFIFDLTPQTFVFSSIRMVTGALLALVLSFAFGSEPHFIPILGFFIGFFPSRGLKVLEKLGGRLLQLGGADFYNTTAISQLPGLGPADEVRLEREGYDNLEDLGSADALDLAIRTGLSYRQLRLWIDQVWLRLHLGADFDAFHQATGITGRRDLAAFLAAWKSEQRPGSPAEYLAQGLDPRFAVKLEVILSILPDTPATGSTAAGRQP